ncbi:hypothetical protein [Sphingomonas sp.]|uniref:hypothetical protein n=1 Tax=Sphingomonas sp. TaxID=28214 RepID=UPI003AFFF6B1
MFDSHPPVSDEKLVAHIDTLLAEVHGARRTALDRIVQCDAEQAQLGYHLNHAAYVPGGMLAERGFGAGHILAVAGFHALDWREALARLDASIGDREDTGLLARLRLACEADPMLEVSGHALFAEFGLLNSGRWKPPLSHQGHLAVTTARALNITLPAARTRGHAANWLDDHDANLRFPQEDRA